MTAMLELMTAGSGAEPTAAIEYTEVARTFCSSCGQSESVLASTQTGDSGPFTAVRIVSIAQVEAGWLARGTIPEAYCAVCGQAYSALIRYIPIECAPFSCPACGPGSKLTPEILSMTEAEEGYSFVAQLKCASCARQSRLSRLLQGLSKITRVKVGPTGVELEVKS